MLADRLKLSYLANVSWYESYLVNIPSCEQNIIRIFEIQLA